MAILNRNNNNTSHLPSPGKTHLSKQAMKGYVFFSENTKGFAGKVINIKIELFTRFAALVDPKTFDGQTTIRQIEALRMTNAASQGVHSNTNSAFRFMLTVANMQIFYSVLDGGASGKKEIFIGDIKANFDKGTDKAGLYVFSSYSKKFISNPRMDLNDKAVYLNGRCKNLNHAMEMARENGVNIGDQNLALFYTPGNVINDLGVWSSAAQLQQVTDSIAMLRDAIKSNTQKRVIWVAEGEGADVFSKALDGVAGELTTHKFRLIDPLTNTPELLQKLKIKKINPPVGENAPVTYTGKNRAATMFTESQKPSLISALKLLRVKGDAEDAHQSSIAGLEATAGNTPLAKNAQALTNTAALNQRVVHTTKAQPTPNKAAMSFIEALRRV